VFKRVAYGIFFLLGLALAINALSYANFSPTYGFLKLKAEAIETGWYLPFYYAHVLVSGLILLSGFLQVLQRVRRRWPSFHRLLGKFYVFGILFFAAPGALIMSLFIGRGPIVLTSFLFQTTLWFLFTLLAFKKAVERDYVQHEIWMMRSFALTLAAITLRLYVFFVSFTPVALNSALAYGTIAWLSWVLNLVAFEVYYSSRARKLVRGHDGQLAKAGK
jgi:hypothetical protein